jgi:solute carrier family 50 protein (sugar transporter)
MSDERSRIDAGRASGRYASVPVDSVAVDVQLDAPTKKAVLSNVVDCVFTIIVMGFGVAIVQGVATAANLGWIDKGGLTFVLSMGCPCIIMAQFISPAAVVVRAVSTMDAENLPTQVFQSQAVCNVLGISYAVQIHNLAVLSANMVGLSCQLVYLACATYIKDEDARWLFWFVRMAAILNGALYVFTMVSSIRILGHLITVFNIVLFASPLTKVAHILHTRSADSLPLAMTCIGFLSNGVWTLYSMMIEDMVVLLPSLLGFLLSSFQVLLIAWCRDLLPFDLAFLEMFVGPESPDAVGMTPRATMADIVEEDEGSPLVASMESGFGVPLVEVVPVDDVALV